MKTNQPVKTKKSLGALHKAEKTKETSPIMTGKLKLQYHTFAAIAEEFGERKSGEVVCNIAGWQNKDKHGEYYLTVELSPPFPPKRPKARLFSWLCDDEDE
jgi:hypothetical protein